MRLKWLYLALLFVFSLLAGCSRVVAPPDDQDESSTECDISEEDGGDVSSARLSSSADFSSSSSLPSSSSVKSSSSVRSSSSIIWISSSSEKPYVLENSPWNTVAPPSSNKRQPQVSSYPYYAYVDMSWSYDNTESKPPFFISEDLSESRCLWTDVNELGEITFGIYYYTNLNELIEYSRSITYSFYPTGARIYQLSVEKVRGESMPYLRVLGTNEYNEDAVIIPVEKNGRWYYRLDAAELGFTDKPVSLVRYAGDPEKGWYSLYGSPANDLIISDESYSGYTRNFNVNLIVAGKYMGTDDSVSVEELAERIHARLNLALNPGGIGVRKVNVLYAKDHPAVGSDFPESEEVLLYRDKSKKHVSIDMLSKWPGHEGDLSIVLGYYVADDISSGVAGFSPMPGNIYNTLKSIACESDRICESQISLATHRDSGNTAMSSSEITNAAIHELGHFFGLDHTTALATSPVFDTVDDTPECSDIISNIESLEKCPDFGYIMFPITDYSYEYATFTPQQMDVIRTYLSSRPHK